VNHWQRILESIFSDPDQRSSLKSLFRIILFQLSLLVIIIFFGFVLAISTSPLIKSFALSVIIANLIYCVIFGVADTDEGDPSSHTTSVSGDVGFNPSDWGPFKALKVWYAIVISILTVVFRIYFFT
jgi:hypothetical protein